MQIRHSDNEFYAVSGLHNDMQKPQSKNKKSNLKKTICIAGSCIGALVLIAIIVVIILFATIPCKLLKCHQKAIKCINHPFRPECICDYGYQGDGYWFCDECGLTSQTQNLRIVGGVEAVPNSWPSAALVVFSYKNLAYISSLGVYVSIDQAYSCGAVLIDRNTLLTAAHCIQESVRFTYNGISYVTKVTTSSNYPTIESMYKVYLGVHDRTKMNQPPAMQLSVKKVYRHESYDETSKLNDIGIIKLSKEAELNQYIQISCLPNPNTSFYPSEVNIKSFAIGWGTLNYGDQTGSDLLQNVDLTIYDGSKCKDVSIYENDWNSQICAGNYSGGKDTCQGDSGGSLFVLDKVNQKDRFITAGIVSYGKECARPGLPGIYTRVSYYGEWIQSNKWKYN